MEENNQKEQRKVRSSILTLLCVLTFIGSGLGTFTFIMVYMSYDEVMLAFEEVEKQFPQLEAFFHGGPKFFLTAGILYFISLMGAIQMWQLRKIGFHMYAAAQIFLLIVPVAIIDTSMISFVEVLITFGFIAGYFSQIKLLS